MPPFSVRSAIIRKGDVAAVRRLLSRRKLSEPYYSVHGDIGRSDGLTDTVQENAPTLHGCHCLFIKTKRVRLIYECVVWVIHLTRPSTEEDFGWIVLVGGFDEFWSTTESAVERSSRWVVGSGAEAMRMADRLTNSINPFDWNLTRTGWLIVFFSSGALTAYFFGWWKS